MSGSARHSGRRKKGKQRATRKVSASAESPSTVLASLGGINLGAAPSAGGPSAVPHLSAADSRVGPPLPHSHSSGLSPAPEPVASSSRLPGPSRPFLFIGDRLKRPRSSHSPSSQASENSNRSRIATLEKEVISLKEELIFLQEQMNALGLSS
jgi:hypothetical protein